MPKQYDKEKWKKANISTMDEFKSMLRAEIIMGIKEAELFVDAQAQGQVSQKLKQVSQDTQTASTALGNFMDLAKNLADDEVAAEEPTEKELQELQLEEELKAKAELLEELGQMAREAAYSGDYKTAYKIERTADSILHEEPLIKE